MRKTCILSALVLALLAVAATSQIPAPPPEITVRLTREITETVDFAPIRETRVVDYCAIIHRKTQGQPTVSVLVTGAGSDDPATLGEMDPERTEILCGRDKLVDRGYSPPPLTEWQ